MQQEITRRKRERNNLDFEESLDKRPKLDATSQLSQHPLEITEILKRIFSNVTDVKDIVRAELVSKTFQQHCWTGFPAISLVEINAEGKSLEFCGKPLNFAHFKAIFPTVWKKAQCVRTLNLTSIDFDHENRDCSCSTVLGLLDWLNGDFPKKITNLSIVGFSCHSCVIPILIRNWSGSLTILRFEWTTKEEPWGWIIPKDFEVAVLSAIRGCSELEKLAFLGDQKDEIAFSEQRFSSTFQDMPRLVEIDIGDFWELNNIRRVIPSLLSVLNNNPEHQPTRFTLKIGYFYDLDDIESQDSNFKFVTKLATTYCEHSAFERAYECFPNLESCSLRLEMGISSDEIADHICDFFTIYRSGNNATKRTLNISIRGSGVGLFKKAGLILRTVVKQTGATGTISVDHSDIETLSDEDAAEWDMEKHMSIHFQKGAVSCTVKEFHD